MRAGVFISALLHVALITLAVAGLPFSADDSGNDNDIVIIPVDVVRAEDVAAAPKIKPPPAPRKKRPQRRVAEVPDALDNVPTFDKAVRPRARPKAPQRRRTARLAPRVKPRPPSRFNVGKIAALLDKREREKKKNPPPAETDRNAKKVVDLDAGAVVATVNRRRLTASLRDAMRVQIERCWIVPAGARDAGALTIRIRIFLNRDGSLARPPEIIDRSRMNKAGQEFWRAAAEGARRAVQKCAPLDLPREHFDIWRVTELTFEPGKMLGG